MVQARQEHMIREERDDMQHIAVQKLLSNRPIARPTSRLNKLLSDRFARMYEDYGESLDPAKRKQLTVAGANRKEPKQRDPQAINYAARSSGANGTRGDQDRSVVKVVSGIATNPPEIEYGDEQRGVSPAPQSNIGAQRGSQLKERERGKGQQIVFNQSTQTAPRIRKTAVEQSLPPWVLLLSQILGVDLNRVGFEPDELDDIRVLLIKEEARLYEPLQLLSRLPDSLAPEAITKVFEDIRTIAIGYMAFVFMKRDEEVGEDDVVEKQARCLPRTITNPFYDIPMIEFDPADILSRIDD
jgi:hypothetical protein